MHYQGDQFNPAEQNEYMTDEPRYYGGPSSGGPSSGGPGPGILDDDISYATVESNIGHGSVSSLKGRSKKLIQDYKNLDKGYRSIIRYIDRKKVRIDLYVTSYVPGTLIRDAVSGLKYGGFRVGTFGEDYFFKVKIATGELGRDAGHLYFETPSQCEKYLRIQLSEKTKKKWNTKYEDFCKKFKLT